jgi:hypothetical protein
MKLYIWGSTKYTPDYGSDTLVVFANNLREARKLALNAIDFGFGREAGARPRREIDVSKDKPTLVIDRPDAIYCWWAE